METRRDVFQAIADPTRRAILALLLQTELQNLNALAHHFKMTRQAVSLHVKVLQECDVIKIVQKGRERMCQLKPRKIKHAAEWFHPFHKLWDDRLNQLDKVLANMNPRKSK